MAHTWQLQEAKNKLSEVVDRALHTGPQIITRRGAEVAVVISYDEYSRLQGAQTSLSEFFRQSPLGGIDLSRDQSPPRPDIPL
jgi:prevent-host-death family protein